MKVFNPRTIDLSYLDWSEYIFARKALATYAVAVQVIPENIGQLAIEFGSEIFRGGPNEMYFTAVVERDGGKTATGLTFHLNDWLMIMDEQFHCFPDVVFSNTFKVSVEDVEPPAPKTLDELAPLNRHGSTQDTFNQVRQDMGLPPINQEP